MKPEQSPHDFDVREYPSSDLHYSSESNKEIKRETAEEQQELTTKQKAFGIVLMTIGCIHFSIQGMFIKVVINEFSLQSTEILYYMSVVGIIFFNFTIKYNNKDALDIQPELRWWVFYRVFFGCVQDICLYIAFMFTNYSKAYCIFFGNTLLIPFFARWFIKEPISKYDIVAILFGFAGMLMIIQPWKFAKTASGAEAVDQA